MFVSISKPEFDRPPFIGTKINVNILMTPLSIHLSEFNAINMAIYLCTSLIKKKHWNYEVKFIVIEDGSYKLRNTGIKHLYRYRKIRVSHV